MMTETTDNQAASASWRWYGRVPWWKLPLDYAVLLFLLPAILFCFAVIAIIIKLVSRGPVFFKQERIGFQGKPFLCYKFRTMHPQAETQTHVLHVKDLVRSNQPMKKLDATGDNRLIPFGGALRASGLDELPQLINVLKREMSIVGPRPCIPYEYELFEEWQKERNNALPGLTGLWQVSGKNRTTFAQMIELDIRYARTATAWKDIEIILKTFPTLMGQIAERVNRKASAAVAPAAVPGYLVKDTTGSWPSEQAQ